MSSSSIKKIIPCKKNQLIEMVLDVEQYPEFVPWCIEGKIYDKKESEDLITFSGDLKVGKSGKSYASVNTYKPDNASAVATVDLSAKTAPADDLPF